MLILPELTLRRHSGDRFSPLEHLGGLGRRGEIKTIASRGGIRQRKTNQPFDADDIRIGDTRSHRDTGKSPSRNRPAVVHPCDPDPPICSHTGWQAASPKIVQTIICGKHTRPSTQRNPLPHGHGRTRIVPPKASPFQILGEQAHGDTAIFLQLALIEGILSGGPRGYEDAQATTDQKYSDQHGDQPLDQGKATGVHRVVVSTN